MFIFLLTSLKADAPSNINNTKNIKKKIITFLKSNRRKIFSLVELSQEIKEDKTIVKGILINEIRKNNIKYKIENGIKMYYFNKECYL